MAELREENNGGKVDGKYGKRTGKKKKMHEEMGKKRVGGPRVKKKYEGKFNEAVKRMKRWR